MPSPLRPADPGFDALLAEGLALVPAYAPEWTNHNVSDPGVTLIELLAYFTDALQYRLGRVDKASEPAFLRLLRGDAADAASVRPDGPQALREALAAALDEIDRLDCAVTPADHEELALRALVGLPHGAATRVRCLPETDLGTSAPDDVEVGQHPGHVSVVVFPAAGAADADAAVLLQAVREQLEPRRLLASRLHVCLPRRVHLGVRLRARAAAGADRPALAHRVAQALADWRPSGPQDDSPATLALSEIADRAALVDGIDGVDAVVLLHGSLDPALLHTDASTIGLQLGQAATLGHGSRLGAGAMPSAHRLVRNDDGELAAIRVRAWEQPHVVLRPADLSWTSGADAAQVA